MPIEIVLTAAGAWQWIGITADAQTMFAKLAESAKHAHSYLSAEEELRGRGEKAAAKKAAKEEAKARKKAEKPSKPKREPSAYNIFMKAELPRVKVPHPNPGSSNPIKTPWTADPPTQSY